VTARAAAPSEKENDMRTRQLYLGALMAALVVAAPSRASADWLITPFVGGVLGGNADFGDFDDFDDEVERRVNAGASLGWMGEGIIGFEVDFGWTPNFFEDTVGDADFAFGDSNVTTLMGNVLVGAPIGGQTGPGVRPYASGGVGLIRANIDGGDFFDDLNSNDFGMNVGAGIHAFFSDNVGVRGDVRYFRSLEDNEADGEFDLGLADFDFWRATVGVTFRFAAQ
jgi:opacity protein-like surface antigen